MIHLAQISLKTDLTNFNSRRTTRMLAYFSGVNKRAIDMRTNTYSFVLLTMNGGFSEELTKGQESLS